MTEPLAPGSRWHTLLQHAADALYLLNRRRDVLCVNAAWERLTGFTAAAVRGARCKRDRDAVPASLEALLSTLSPPADVKQGRPARVRRALPRPNAAPDFFDITFFPLTGAKGRLLLLGKVVPVPRQAAWVQQPLPPRLLALRERAARWFSPDHLPDVEPAQRRLIDQIRLASQVDVSVLLVGEAGTGKEWTARTIHQLGRSAERAFAAVDCARLPPAALAAALFGEPGLCYRAFAGTVYLNEPSRLPRELQAKLCDLIKSPPPPGTAARRPRVMAGCSADPVGEMQAGRLSEELYCALSPLTVALAPLRERTGDIAFLALRILERLNVEAEQAVTDLTTEVWERLMAYRWPGNVAELHTVLAGACARAKGWRVEEAHLPWHLRSPAPPPKKTISLDEALLQVERRLIELALVKAGGNNTRAASLLSISRASILWRMKKLGLSGE